MNEVPTKRLQQTLATNDNVVFAYIFGSAAGPETRTPVSDLDIADFFIMTLTPRGITN